MLLILLEIQLMQLLGMIPVFWYPYPEAAHKEHQVLKACRVYRGHKLLKVFKAYKVHKLLKVYKVYRVPQVVAVEVQVAL